MERIATVLKRVLRQHEPFPAVVMDRYWNVVMTNDAAPRFFGRFIDMDARPRPRNLLHLIFDPAGMRPFVEDWESVSKSLLARVCREFVGRALDEHDARACGVPAQLCRGRARKDCGPTPLEPVLPMIPISFVKDGRRLSYFSMITTVGSAADGRGAGIAHRMHVSGGRSDRGVAWRVHAGAAVTGCPNEAIAAHVETAVV